MSSRAAFLLPILATGCGFPLTYVGSGGVAEAYSKALGQRTSQVRGGFSVVPVDAPFSVGVDGTMVVPEASFVTARGGAHASLAAMPLPFERPVGVELVGRVGAGSTERADSGSGTLIGYGAASLGVPIRASSRLEPWKADRDGRPLVVLEPFLEVGCLWGKDVKCRDYEELAGGLWIRLMFWARESP